jgi:hypothetical protein
LDIQAVSASSSVCIPWGACTWNLQTQCKNKQNDKAPVVFEVIAYHTTKVLHASAMFWGACGDSLIVKYDKAVHAVMDGQYSVLPFEVEDKHGKPIVIYGLYYICNGGHPKFKYVVCPFKWPQIGTDVEFWSKSLESTRKDIERCFGAIKKCFTMLVSSNTLADTYRIKQVLLHVAFFTTVCLLTMGATIGARERCQCQRKDTTRMRKPPSSQTIIHF